LQLYSPKKRKKKKEKKLSLPNLILEGDAFNVFNPLQSVFVLPNWLVAPILEDFDRFQYFI